MALADTAPSVSQPSRASLCSQALEEGWGRRDLFGCQPQEHTVHLPGGHLPFCCVFMPRLVFQESPMINQSMISLGTRGT